MNAIDVIVDEIRILQKKLASLETRLDTLILPGTVTAVSGDRVRLDLGEAVDGRIETPDIRIAQPSGKNGGGVATYIKPGTGEAMFVVSPGGRLGDHSRAFFAGPVDDHPSSGSASSDTHVRATGNVRVEEKNNQIKYAVGTVNILITQDGIVLDGPVLMPKGFAAGATSGTSGTLNGRLHVTDEIRSDTKVAAPILEGTLL
jgi:hypothetical protein